jgi:hypothetical protein
VYVSKGHYVKEPLNKLGLKQGLGVYIFCIELWDSEAFDGLQFYASFISENFLSKNRLISFPGDHLKFACRYSYFQHPNGTTFPYILTWLMPALSSPRFLYSPLQDNQQMLKDVFIIVIKLPRHVSAANCHLQRVTRSL